MSETTIQVGDSAADFFMNIVPQILQGQVGEVEDGPGSICFDLTGRGQWSMAVKGGKIQMTAGRSEDTLVQVTVDGSRWKETAVRLAGLGGMGLMGAAGGPGISSLLGNPAVETTLRAAQGTLKVVTQTDDGDDWVAVTFGGAEPDVDAPRAGLTMTQEVANELAAGGTTPQELFMAGKIQITGDMMMFMQLMPIMQAS